MITGTARLSPLAFYPRTHRLSLNNKRLNIPTIIVSSVPAQFSMPSIRRMPNICPARVPHILVPIAPLAAVRTAEGRRESSNRVAPG